MAKLCLSVFGKKKRFSTFSPDRIEVHQRSCKGPQGGGKAPPPQQQQLQQAAAANNSSSISATALANVEMLLSTPLTIRRQLHSQTDAVVVNHPPVHLGEEQDLGPML